MSVAAAEPEENAREQAARKALQRLGLLVGVPTLALLIAIIMFFMGGRYVETDNAYVGAQKVLVTPLVSGQIVSVHVAEGQKVKVGDPLFDVDAAPFQSALDLAQGRISAARAEFLSLQDSYANDATQLILAQQIVDFRQKNLQRKLKLAQSHAGTQADVDATAAALAQARQNYETIHLHQQAALAKMGGNAEGPIDQYPDYVIAKAQGEDARRNLKNASVHASISGVATQVDKIELGRLVQVGQPIFALVSDHDLWVEANPKESDLTYIHVGDPVSLTIDAFPGRKFKGAVSSIAPGTGAQFAILPPQNASGNWIKVVQRVPLRVAFDPSEDIGNIRSGMSVILTIDTGHRRTLSGAFSDLGHALASFWP